MNFCDVHRKILYSSDRMSIEIAGYLCYNVDTTEREDYSDVQVKYRTSTKAVTIK